MTSDEASKIFYAYFDAASGLIVLLDLINEYGDEELKARSLHGISRALAEIGSIDNKVRMLFPDLHAEVERAVLARDAALSSE